jgi:hypothetical protein
MLKIFKFALAILVYLDRAKNSVRIEKLRIVSEDSEKIVIFWLARE